MHPIITNYHVVDAMTVDNLEIHVIKLIKQGWQPYGEYRVLDHPVPEGHGFTYQQAMVRYDKLDYCIHEFVIKWINIASYRFEIKCQLCGMVPRLTIFKKENIECEK